MIYTVFPIPKEYSNVTETKIYSLSGVFVLKWGKTLSLKV